MTNLKSILTVSVLALSLSGCGDKNKTAKDTSTQKANPSSEIKPTTPITTTLLSEKSSSEDIAKALVGTWESTCIIPPNYPNQSVKAIFDYTLGSNAKTIYGMRALGLDYDNGNCQGKGKLTTERNGKDFPTGYLGSMEILSSTKGTVPIKGIGSDYLVVKYLFNDQISKDKIVEISLITDGKKFSIGNNSESMLLNKQ